MSLVIYHYQGPAFIMRQGQLKLKNIFIYGHPHPLPRRCLFFHDLLPSGVNVWVLWCLLQGVFFRVTPQVHFW